MAKFKKFTPAIGITMGLGAAILSAVLFSAISAHFILNEIVGEHQVSLLAYGTLFLSGIVGNLVATKTVEGKTAVVSGIVSLSILLILLGVHFLFLDSEIYGLGGGILLIIASFGLICWSSLAFGKSKKRFKKIRSR